MYHTKLPENRCRFEPSDLPHMWEITVAYENKMPGIPHRAWGCVPLPNFTNLQNLSNLSRIIKRLRKAGNVKNHSLLIEMQENNLWNMMQGNRRNESVLNESGVYVTFQEYACHKKVRKTCTLVCQTSELKINWQISCFFSLFAQSLVLGLSEHSSIPATALSQTTGSCIFNEVAWSKRSFQWSPTKPA